MKSIHRLQLAQNAAARVIKRTPKREHMTPVLRDLHCHLRSANTPSLVPNRNKTVKFGKRLMDTAAASLWNFLPDEIKCAPNIMISKKHLKTYLFT